MDFGFYTKLAMAPTRFQQFMNDLASIYFSDSSCVELKEVTILAFQILNELIADKATDPKTGHVIITRDFKDYCLMQLQGFQSIWYKEFRPVVRHCQEWMKKVSRKQIVIRKTKDQLERKQDMLANLEPDKYKRILQFGVNMGKLWILIEKNKDKFSKKPIGPLGSCISVFDKMWLGLLESILASYLWVFMVDNPEDAKVLNGMIDQVYGGYVPLVLPNLEDEQWRRPQVWVINFDKCKDNNFSKEVVCGYFTLRDALIIHDDHLGIVESTLWKMIPNFGYILLFRDYPDAFPYHTYDPDLASDYPLKCVVGYTLDMLKLGLQQPFKTSKLKAVKPRFLSCWGSGFKIRELKTGIEIKEKEIKKLSTDYEVFKSNMLITSGTIEKIQKGIDYMQSVIEIFEIEEPKKEDSIEEEL